MVSEIQIESQYKSLFKDSLIKTGILKNVLMTSTGLKFYTNNVKNLSKIIITDNFSINLIDSISRQYKYLENQGFSLLGINIDDITVLDDDIFIILNPKLLYKITEENLIEIKKPIQKPQFKSPELTQLSKIPGKIHYKTFYYSLGALLEYLFPNQNKNCWSKMYYFIQRCKHDIPENRAMLFV
jgi:hypothetical protein